MKVLVCTSDLVCTSVHVQNRCFDDTFTETLLLRVHYKVFIEEISSARLVQFISETST